MLYFVLFKQILSYLTMKSAFLVLFKHILNNLYMKSALLCPFQTNSEFPKHEISLFLSFLDKF